MASTIRTCRPLSAVTSVLRSQERQSSRQLSTAISTTTTTRTIRPPTSTPRTHLRPTTASIHITPSRRRGDDNLPPATDFGALDVLGNTPVPSSSVDICMSDGFHLNSGARILNGAGVLLIGGEAFTWRPWLPRGGHRLLNAKGQWEVPNESLSLLSLLWPRPDLLILGLGPEMRPISPELRRYISSLGMRVEVLDTRNAAAQFNLLATERGVTDVVAALIPIGWREGVGASW
ncbi:Uu.00g005210.m01.CDS01 [Anthostomella pinea]|uniref:Uu.00g005210.m01.CDS01 n=1 Tax=Anthostomella pinea TaxID=933095 RepID=A0AAI8YIS3_9PEZI|nr:Uu.00g005210.m01.CDS01 [Anthostomella pinea]